MPPCDLGLLPPIWRWLMGKAPASCWRSCATWWALNDLDPSDPGLWLGPCAPVLGGQRIIKSHVSSTFLQRNHQSEISWPEKWWVITREKWWVFQKNIGEEILTRIVLTYQLTLICHHRVQLGSPRPLSEPRLMRLSLSRHKAAGQSSPRGI